MLYYAISCNNIIMLYDVAVFAGGEADLHCIFLEIGLLFIVA